MRDRAPCDQLVVGLDAECRNNGFDNRSAGLLLLNDRHGPVQGNWTWHGKRHHAPDLHRQPVRVGVAIAAGVAWRLQYSVARIQQPRLMSGWYSVCTVGRCLREPADERAQQLLGITAGANYLDNEQLLNSVSERLLLSTERNCWHALLQPDVVWHGDERCVPGLHRQPVRVAIAAGVAFSFSYSRSPPVTLSGIALAEQRLYQWQSDWCHRQLGRRKRAEHALASRI